MADNVVYSLDMDKENDELSAKKPRDNHDDIYRAFDNNRAKTEALRKEYDNLTHDNVCSIFPLVIEECNAAFRVGQHFNTAYCFTDVYEAELFAYPLIFQKGHRILKPYIKDRLVPHEKINKLILAKLLSYLLDTAAHMALRKAVHRQKDSAGEETQLTLAFGQHLFSKLTIVDSFVVDKFSYSDKKMFEKCSCGCGEIFKGTFGDNSIGNPNCWHGNVDLLINHQDQVPVVAGHGLQDENALDDSLDGSSTDKVKISQNINNSDLDHMIAKSIVFSFVQKKRHPEYDNYLIPSIGIAKEQIIFHFYDSERDILLQSAPLNLFYTNQAVNIKTIIAVWLVVNYRYLCTGVTQEMQQKIPKARFFQHAGKSFPLYQSGVTLGDVRKEADVSGAIGPKDFYRGNFNTLEG